jgi:hypothetical protein
MWMTHQERPFVNRGCVASTQADDRTQGQKGTGGPLKKPVLACDGSRCTMQPSQSSPPGRDVMSQHEPQKGRPRRQALQVQDRGGQIHLDRHVGEAPPNGTAQAMPAFRFTVHAFDWPSVASVAGLPREIPPQPLAAAAAASYPGSDQPKCLKARQYFVKMGPSRLSGCFLSRKLRL